MNPYLLACLLLSACAIVPSFGASAVPRDEQQGAVHGRLGIPFKTQAKVEAEIVRAEDVGRDDLAGQYLLRIRKVDGVKLEPNQTFRFALAPGVSALPHDVFALYQQVTGKTVDELTPDEVQLAEKDFVGSVRIYLCNEMEIPPKVPGLKSASDLANSKLVLTELLDPS